jgi:hypothetical protein
LSGRRRRPVILPFVFILVSVEARRRSLLVDLEARRRSFFDVVR